jgi:hypothetical protein
VTLGPTSTSKKLRVSFLNGNRVNNCSRTTLLELSKKGEKLGGGRDRGEIPNRHGNPCAAAVFDRIRDRDGRSFTLLVVPAATDSCAGAGGGAGAASEAAGEEGDVEGGDGRQRVSRSQEL